MLLFLPLFSVWTFNADYVAPVNPCRSEDTFCSVRCVVLQLKGEIQCDFCVCSDPDEYGNNNFQLSKRQRLSANTNSYDGPSAFSFVCIIKYLFIVFDCVNMRARTRSWNQPVLSNDVSKKSQTLYTLLCQINSLGKCNCNCHYVVFVCHMYDILLLWLASLNMFLSVNDHKSSDYENQLWLYIVRWVIVNFTSTSLWTCYSQTYVLKYQGIPHIKLHEWIIGWRCSWVPFIVYMRKKFSKTTKLCQFQNVVTFFLFEIF